MFQEEVWKKNLTRGRCGHILQKILLRKHQMTFAMLKIKLAKN